MEILGVDPGLSGGLSFYEGGRKVIVYPIPTYEVQFTKKGKKRTRREMDLVKVCEIIRSHDPVKAYIEKVNAMTGQGVTGMFRFGCNFGDLRGILTAILGEEPEYVRPQVWKAYFDLLKTDKSASLDLARETFSESADSFRLKKHDGLAEASLIAKYGHDHYS